MNLFLLDARPQISATYHTDKHVVKMVLETAQILCSAHWICDGYVGEGWYALTHKNHPVVQWCASSLGAYKYSYAQFKWLAYEYRYRFKRDHLSWVKFGSVLNEPPDFIPHINTRQYIMAMPEKYWPIGAMSRLTDIRSAVLAYRRYYRGDKYHLFTWTNRQVPEWVLS